MQLIEDERARVGDLAHAARRDREHRRARRHVATQRRRLGGFSRRADTRRRRPATAAGGRRAWPPPLPSPPWPLAWPVAAAAAAAAAVAAATPPLPPRPAPRWLPTRWWRTKGVDGLLVALGLLRAAGATALHRDLRAQRVLGLAHASTASSTGDQRRTHDAGVALGVDGERRHDLAGATRRALAERRYAPSTIRRDDGWLPSSNGGRSAAIQEWSTPRCGLRRRPRP